MRIAILAVLMLSISASFCTNSPHLVQNSDFRNEIIYFLLTDRFFNGNPENDDGQPRPSAFDEKDSLNPIGWHGGDFAGITQKIREGYFQAFSEARATAAVMWLQIKMKTSLLFQKNTQYDSKTPLKFDSK